ncbi:hypothetical protein T265_09059 [Opisthorchis viverrini]|uniref:Uncharacterized protein n=1 Tax=Opisthorchis viverrini TaxID=6198 RepID=A0A075A6A7_OPIVI|nr:hypothetical protein T265_09059 [Opisthorchis viverrini]KER22979.1 hypothetical protein T265_09059 [Opisthorchis viverrini]
MAFANMPVLVICGAQERLRSRPLKLHPPVAFPRIYINARDLHVAEHSSECKSPASVPFCIYDQ